MANPVSNGLQRDVNFGGNQSWLSRRYRPANEAALLSILGRHSGDTIRALGSKHSWSDIAAGAAVSLDMSGFDEVEPFVREGRHFVRVGAGVRLQNLLGRLHRMTDQTLPTLGAIKKQTISGATATGTHGSGRESLSHFISKVRLAAYDPRTRAPAIYEYDAGPELRAARCGLGCMGIVLSVELPTVRKYKVAEVIRSHESLQSILSVYSERPLTQFLWAPYAWKAIAFERKDVGWPTTTLLGDLKTWLMRAYNVIGQDIVFHVILLLKRSLGARTVKGFLRRAPRLILKGVERVDHAEHVLTLGHHYFRHEEMEVFVDEARLIEAAEVIRCAIEVFAAKGASIPDGVTQRLGDLGLGEQLLPFRGRFVHHYPIIFRRVLPDDTMLSMAASSVGPVYSISLFSYDPPGRRQPFYDLCGAVARILHDRFDARLHWGKHFPSAFADIAIRYPEMEAFRALCRRNDPHGVFRNAYTERVLGLRPCETMAQTTS
jgi:FAD/FMN-containing dehydrogenase